MSAPKRKYLSEFAVSLYSARIAMLSASQLASDNEISPEIEKFFESCHIYLICSRPAVSFDPANFSYDKERIKGNLKFKVGGKTKNLPFDRPFQLCDGATSLKLSDYPHREIQTSSPGGELVRNLPAYILSLHPEIKSEEMHKLEVLYIGQTFAEGNRTPIDRLKSHSTLQKILSNMQYEKPDEEAFILIVEYCPYQIITSMDGTDKEAIKDKNDSKRFLDIHENPLTKHQQICLIEAGLIRYFQPEYNEKFKEKFPNVNQKLLDECYRLDFSALIVEIDTEDLGKNLFSHTTPPKTHHTAKFDLIDPDSRKSFFSIKSEDGKQVNLPNVIPPSR